MLPTTLKLGPVYITEGQATINVHFYIPAKYLQFRRTLRKLMRLFRDID